MAKKRKEEESLPQAMDQGTEQSSSITYANDVVAIIAGLAASEVEGVAGMCSVNGSLLGKNKNMTRGVKVEVGTEEASIDLYMIVEYGTPIQRAAHDAQESVKKAIESVENSDLFHQGNCKVYSGPIVSGDWFVNTKEKMQSILEKFPKAMAVDMESCSIAQTCYIYRVAFISFRIISDVPLKDQNASQYFDFWNRLAEGSFNATKSFLTNIDYQL